MNVPPLAVEAGNDGDPPAKEDLRDDSRTEARDPSLSELDADLSNLPSPLSIQIEVLAVNTNEDSSVETPSDPAPIDELAQQLGSALFGTQSMADDASGDELRGTFDIVRAELPRLPPIDTSISSLTEDLSGFLSPETNEPSTPNTSYSAQSQFTPQSPIRTLFPSPGVFCYSRNLGVSKRHHRAEDKAVQTDLASQHRLRRLQESSLSSSSSTTVSPSTMLSPLFSLNPRPFFDALSNTFRGTRADETSPSRPRMILEVSETAIHLPDQVPVASAVSLTNSTTDLT
jgi:hypothetical protein